MALNFDVSAVADFKTITTHPTDANKWHPVTEALTWHAMIIGVPVITQENAGEFFRRVAIWEHITGPMLSGQRNLDWRITMSDVINHVGLRTNASSLTNAKFAAKVMQELGRQADLRLRSGETSLRHRLAEAIEADQAEASA